MSPVIELTGVRYDGEADTEPLTLSLAVSDRTYVVLLGPVRSGTGTVLRLCAGLLVPDEGTVRVLGQDPAEFGDEVGVEFRLRVGVVLQPPGLLSNMTVFNNVALPLRYHSERNEGDIESVVMRSLTDLGLEAIRDRFPATLTLGEAKVAALARALVMEPELLLLEEPDAGLDAESMERCQSAMLNARARRPLAVLATMSHPSPLQASADRVVYMRSGRVVAEGRRAELLKTASGEMLAYLGA